MVTDREFLLQALQLARKRRGSTFPNPAVGAVFVKNELVIGTGFHLGAGFPHAEVEALKEVGERAEGATLYVTLEPCCHFGRTPPCTELLKARKIGRLVYAFQDPNPLVSGKGAALLAAAGMKVEHLPQKEITEFYQPYSWWSQSRKTWLTGKLALSRNEKVSSCDGKPVKITGPLADAYTHFRRREADVMVTSLKTLESDNPRLDARQGEILTKKPVWVLDRRLRFSVDYRVMKTASSVSLVHGGAVAPGIRDKQLQSGMECLEVREHSQGLALSDLALQMGQRGYHEAWIEVGPKLFSAFMEEKLFQELVLYRSSSIEIPEGLPAFLKKKDTLFQGYRKIAENSLAGDRCERWLLK